MFSCEFSKKNLERFLEKTSEQPLLNNVGSRKIREMTD